MVCRKARAERQRASHCASCDCTTLFSRIGRDAPRDTLLAGRFRKSLIVPRAIPSPTPAKPQEYNWLLLKRYSSPSSRRSAGLSREVEKRCGTNRSFTTYSLLAVPRRPIVCQMSFICTLDFGNSMVRTLPVPATGMCAPSHFA